MMKKKLAFTAILLLFTFLAIGLWLTRRDSAPKNSIIGSWETTSGEVFGTQVLSQEAWGMRITFAEGKATLNFDTGNGRESFDGLCRNDPDGHSGWIDLGQPRSEDPSRVSLGIYKVGEDTLQINMGKERPSDLDQPALSVLKFKRIR
jgi:uncharacterized protein (TIGR03067 family)